MSRTGDRIYELMDHIEAGDEGDLEKADLAGRFLHDAGVGTPTITAFLKHLSDGDRGELLAHLEEDEDAGGC